MVPRVIFFGLLLKMVRSWLILFVLFQLTIISASRLLKHGEDCGGCCFSHSSDQDRELFYVDGKLVDRLFFCNYLIVYHEKHCLLTEYARKKYCQSIAGRKSVETVVQESSESTVNDTIFMAGMDKDGNPLLKPEMLAMGVPAFFLFCFMLLCPCFQPRKRDSEQSVLTKEPSSMDSATPSQMNPPFVNFPWSPQRMPPSPLRVPQSPSRFSMSPKNNKLGSVHLSMSQVVRATHNFSPSQRIGATGFGFVYKAELPDGQVVAVKRARKEQFEGAKVHFRSEVELLAKINHRNLIKLLGYVEKGSERVIITEFVPNGTLREHLDGVKGKILNFKQRLEIAIDVAHGLTHLHLYAEKRIIHRHITSSNILLTENFSAKVGDFGFARAGEDSEKTHVSTQVKGNLGYLDPEYMRTSQLTDKSDVYSFGILLLEILSGRRPVDKKRPNDEQIMIKWAFKKYEEGRLTEIMDPLMCERVDRKILAKMFGLAIWCAAPTRADRPDMKAVGEHLWAIRKDFRKTQNM